MNKKQLEAVANEHRRMGILRLKELASLCNQYADTLARDEDGVQLNGKLDLIAKLPLQIGADLGQYSAVRKMLSCTRGDRS